jgi:hypothetical protein
VEKAPSERPLTPEGEPVRRLTLHKDTLTELSTGDLSAVVGGDITTVLLPSLQHCPVSGAYPTLPVIYCVTGAGS